MAGMPDPLTECPPPSRFDPDELNNFVPPSPSAALGPPFVVWAPWARALLQSGVLRPQLLLVSLSNVGAHLLHQLPNKKILGSIMLPEISMVLVVRVSATVLECDFQAQYLTYVNNTVEPSPHNRECYLYVVDSDGLLVLASVQYNVSPERARLWAKTVFQAIQPDRVLLLGPIASIHFRGKLSADEPLLFVLETDQQKAENKEEMPVATHFPSGSLVDGAAAALLTHCQLGGHKARLLMAWPDTDMTVVRQLASAITTLVHHAMPQYSSPDFIAAGKATVGRKIQADSELYL